MQLGDDPVTGDPRTLNADDVVTMIMRNTTTDTAAVIVDLTIVDAPTNKVLYDPVDGDLDVAGLYETMYQRTTIGGDIESFPDQQTLDYYFQVDAKPNDA